MKQLAQPLLVRFIHSFSQRFIYLFMFAYQEQVLARSINCLFYVWATLSKTLAYTLPFFLTTKLFRHNELFSENERPQPCACFC